MGRHGIRGHESAEDGSLSKSLNLDMDGLLRKTGKEEGKENWQ